MSGCCRRMHGAVKKAGLYRIQKNGNAAGYFVKPSDFLKAVALDRMDKIQRIDKYYGNSAATDFYKELELLLADC